MSAAIPDRASTTGSLNEATLAIERARSLIDVLSSLAANKGIDELNDGTLYTVLSTVDCALERANGYVQAAFPSKEVQS
jgi:hypothetical protein